MRQTTYTRVGDYLLPNIALSEPQPGGIEPLDRYGHIRRAFLKTHQPILYNLLLLTEKLFPHLHDVDEIADERRKHGVPEEIILAELVYE